MVTRADAARWARGFDEVVGQIAPRFARRATPPRLGLLAWLTRAGGAQERLATGRSGRGCDAGRVQDFLSRMRWDADAVRDDLQAYVAEHLGAADAVLVLDETGFLKEGTKSAGVRRQYSGTAGRIENCQVSVFLGYASRHGRALIDRALYLLQDWASDGARRREARIPDAIAFANKPKLALAMLERARAAGAPFAWVSGDSVYGGDHTIRRWGERHRRGYVLVVTSGQRLGMRPVTTWIEGLPEDAWQRLSAGDGAKGPRLYDWARVPYNGGAERFACASLLVSSQASTSPLSGSTARWSLRHSRLPRAPCCSTSHSPAP